MPSAPQNVAVTPVVSAGALTGVTVTWDAVTGATHYNVYRDGVLLAAGTGVSASPFTDATAAYDATYEYTVTALDAVPTESAQSDPAEQKTFPPNLGYHIRIGTKLFQVLPGSYVKTEQPTPVAPQSSNRIDLAPVKKWVQDDWRGGLGQRKMDDPAMYDDGAVDSYSDPHKLGCLPQILKHGHADPQTNLFDLWAVNPMKFEIRAVSDSATASLYFIIGANGSGEVWKLTNSNGTLSRITLQTKVFNALMNSFHDDPHALLIGTSQEGGSAAGKLYRLNGGTDTFNTTALTTKYDGTGGTFNVPRITALCNFNDEDYIGVGASTTGAAVYRMNAGGQWTISVFRDLDCHYVADMAVWNGRLWILAIMRNRETRLYTTDGNVKPTIAYRWRDGFYARTMFEHRGALYIGGGKDSYDETQHQGKLYRYTGASMDEIAIFDSSGLTTTPVWDSSVAQRVEALASFGKYLAVGMPNRVLADGTNHRGVWFYDPDEDAWHLGAYKDDADHAHTGNFSTASNVITDLIEFDGALYIGMTDQAGSLYYLKNDKTNFVKSFYRTSIFNAGLPGEDKVFSRIAVDVEMAPQSRAVIEYSLDEGDTWTTSGTHDNATDAVVKTTYTDSLGSGAGVIGRSIQLRITLYPGTATTGTPGSASGATSTFITRTVVEYAVVTNKVLYSYSFIVPFSSKQITMLNSVDDRTGANIRDELLALRAARTMVTYEDPEGNLVTCLFTGVDEHTPDLTPDDVDGIHGALPVRLQQMY